MNRSNLLCRLGLLAALWSVGASDADADSLVRVQLASGRVFEGYVDVQSGERLWLRTVRGSMSVLRPIEWSVVKLAAIDDQPTTIEDLRRQIEELKTQIESAPLAEAKAPVADAPGSPSEIVDDEPNVPVVSIQVDASVANWNSNVETDGIVLHVSAIDAWGRTVPVDGTLEVEFIGEGPGTTGMLRTFPTLARWSQHVTPETYFTGDNTFRFPYQAEHPEFNTHLGNYGLVHVTLAVPGHGTFESSANVINLRPYNPMRDRMQQFNRQRFFPTERTGRGMQQQAVVVGGV